MLGVRHDTSDPGRNRLRWGPRLLLLGTSVVLSLAVAEAILRVFDLGPEISAVHRENFRLSDDPVLRYELVPGSADGPLALNADGMRDRDRVVPKPLDGFRIAAVGDSICYGFGCAREDGFPLQLEEALNRSFGGDERSFEVLNFGVTGYNITQTVEAVRRKVLPYHPDLILYQYCLNDPEDSSFELESLLAQLDPAERSYLDRRRHLLDRSQLWRLLVFALQSAGDNGQGREAPEQDRQWAAMRQGRHVEYFASIHAPGPGWDRLTRGLDDLATVSRLEEVPVLVVLFPLMFDLEDYPLQAVHDRVTEAAAGRGLGVLDLTPAFRSLFVSVGRRLALNALHPSGLGHELAAAAILRRLALGGLLPGVDAAQVDRARTRSSGEDQDALRSAAAEVHDP